MEIPFMKQPGVDKRTHRPYSLVVSLDDTVKNRWTMTEQAELHCTCEDFRAAQECRHVREKSNEFLRWKRAALQRLRAALCEGLSLPAFANTFSSRLGIPLEMAQFVIDADGGVTIQFDHRADQRQRAACDWGTMGAAVYTAPDPTEAGALCLLATELKFELWDPIHSVREILSPAPRLPPALFKDIWGGEPKKESGLYRGQSGVVRLDGNPGEAVQPPELGDAWAAYWARLCGLTLVGEGWSGAGRYLPGWTLGGKPVGGLAFDLIAGRVTGIPADDLEAYSRGVPETRQQQIGHVHIPWRKEAGPFAGGMVLVRHPDRNLMGRNDDLVVLTTNLWQNLQLPESEEVRTLIAITAAYLVRMGHNPNATLGHGAWSNQLGQLAEMAESEHIDQAALGWRLSEEGVVILREQLVPALLNNMPFPVSPGSWGEDWHLFLPPKAG